MVINGWKFSENTGYIHSTTEGLTVRDDPGDRKRNTVTHDNETNQYYTRVLFW